MASERQRDPGLGAPTGRMVAGLIFTLLAIGAYAGFTLQSVHRMREIQTQVIDRTRLGSLQLIRIQNDLNALGLAMRDMLDDSAGYPMTAWRAPLERIRQNLDDGIARESELAKGRRKPEQSEYLRSSVAEFWRATGDALRLAESGDLAGAKRAVRDTLQPRQEALTALTARMLVDNNDEEARVSAEIGAIFSRMERNAYILLAVFLVLTAVISAALIRANRRLFAELEALANQRRELARQLIATQESTLRAISRDLHDEFGQILTALGAMLRRANRVAPQAEFTEQVQEAGRIVQEALEKVRALSQSLQPVMLEEQGLAATIVWHLSVFERQTGIRVRYEPPAGDLAIPHETAIHIFRVLQEALNNVARHAGVEEVYISLEHNGSHVELKVSDRGKGLPDPLRPGVGLAAMRERAELVGGSFRVARGAQGGTEVVLRVPSREVPVA